MNLNKLPYNSKINLEELLFKVLHSNDAKTKAHYLNLYHKEIQRRQLAVINNKNFIV